MKEKKSKKKAIVLILLIMIFLIGSIILAVIAFQDIPKYKMPYIFVLVVAILGIIIGHFVWKKVKSTIQKHSLKKLDDDAMKIYIVMTVIGFVLFAINGVNIMSAQKTNCEMYTIKNKYRSESGFRKPEVNTLIVNLENRSESIVCKYRIWSEKRIGDKINLCFYESYFGFNYIEIEE